MPKAKAAPKRKRRPPARKAVARRARARAQREDATRAEVPVEELRTAGYLAGAVGRVVCPGCGDAVPGYYLTASGRCVECAAAARATAPRAVVQLPPIDLTEEQRAEVREFLKRAGIEPQ